MGKLLLTGIEGVLCSCYVPTMSETQVQQPDERAVFASEKEAGSGTSLLFVGACVVLPILWGVIVHRIFRRIRGEEQPPEVPNDSVWPDYEI